MGLVRFGHFYGLWPHQHHAADPHYHSVIAVLIIFVALIRLLIYDAPFFP